MKSFAEDLAARFVGNPAFNEMFDSLIAAAVAVNLPNSTSTTTEVKPDIIDKLLYCGAIFVQVDSEHVKSLAQGIAIASLVVSVDSVVREKSFRLLSDLGNFPSLAFAESQYQISNEAFGNILRRR